MLGSMQEEPPTDAEFVFVEHRLRIRWDVLAITAVYVGTWVAVAYTQHSQAITVTCVVLAGLCYPTLALVSHIRETVSGHQADALRRRLDWRRRAIPRPGSAD